MGDVPALLNHSIPAMKCQFKCIVSIIFVNVMHTQDENSPFSQLKHF